MSRTLTLARKSSRNKNSPKSHLETASRGRRGPCKQRRSYLVICRRYRRCPTAVHFAKSAQIPLNLTLSRWEGNYSCFSLLCALTFQSHRDGKFFPGCTLASVTFPSFSLARFAAAVRFRHLWQTRKCSFFSLRLVLMWPMRSRRFTSNSPWRKGNLQGANREHTYVECVPGSICWFEKARKSYVQSVRESKSRWLNFPCSTRISGYECRHLWANNTNNQIYYS